MAALNQIIRARLPRVQVKREGKGARGTGLPRESFRFERALEPIGTKTERMMGRKTRLSGDGASRFFIERPFPGIPSKSRSPFGGCPSR